MKLDSEERRQTELDALHLDAFAETAFDDLTKLAADMFDVPMATISIVDGERQWFKSKLGVGVSETPRALAFCDYTIRTPNEMFVIEDATQDKRFASHPLVTGQPGLRFYAAAPLTLSSGYAIGTLCVMDTQPHHVEPDKLKQLRFMADQVVATLEARNAVHTDK